MWVGSDSRSRSKIFPDFILLNVLRQLSYGVFLSVMSVIMFILVCFFLSCVVRFLLVFFFLSCLLPCLSSCVSFSHVLSGFCWCFFLSCKLSCFWYYSLSFLVLSPGLLLCVFYTLLSGVISMLLSSVICMFLSVISIFLSVKEKWVEYVDKL